MAVEVVKAYIAGILTGGLLVIAVDLALFLILRRRATRALTPPVIGQVWLVKGIGLVQVTGLRVRAGEVERVTYSVPPEHPAYQAEVPIAVFRAVAALVDPADDAAIH